MIGQSHILKDCLLVAWLAMLTLATSSTTASAQSELPPDSTLRRVELLTRSDGTTMSGMGLLALHRDTALFTEHTNNTVVVFEREPGADRWTETATLVANDGTPRFATTAATDGDVIAVGSDHTVFVYERAADRTWREVAKLTQEHETFGRLLLSGPTTILAGGFVFERTPHSGWQEAARLTGDTPRGCCFAVATSGSTIVGGVPGDVHVPGDPGLAYVFERDESADQGWTRVARLTGPTLPAGIWDAFGFGVSLDGDSLLVAANLGAAGGAYVYSRNHGGPGAWGQVAILQTGRANVPSVSVRGDTAILHYGARDGVYVFRQNAGGQDAWGEVASIFGNWTGGWSVGDDILVLDEFSYLPGIPRGGAVFARNQGGTDKWGAIAEIQLAPHGDGAIPLASRISGDTILFGGSRSSQCAPHCEFVGPVGVYVLDTDRDGVRDGADPCPRDPLNNVAGGCARDSAAYSVLDSLVTLNDVEVESSRQPFVIHAKFTNTSNTAITNPFVEVIELTGGNVLENADGGTGGVGATLSPDVGDGVLSPGESMTVTFVIRLETRDSFSFRVTVRGETTS